MSSFPHPCLEIVHVGEKGITSQEINTDSFFISEKKNILKVFLSSALAKIKSSIFMYRYYSHRPVRFKIFIM